MNEMNVCMILEYGSFQTRHSRDAIFGNKRVYGILNQHKTVDYSKWGFLNRLYA